MSIQVKTTPVAVADDLARPAVLLSAEYNIVLTLPLYHSVTLTQIRLSQTAMHDFSIVLQHTVVLEDGEEDPSMEIKEWLDDSGKQTSVDVTDLGKV